MRNSQIVMGVEIIRLSRSRGAQMSNGLRDPAGSKQSAAESIFDDGVSWPQGESQPILFDSIRRSATSLQHGRKIVMGLEIGRVVFNVMAREGFLKRHSRIARIFCCCARKNL